jgi:hypothetical protein
MIGWWRRWVAVMDRKEPATGLALVRIGVAVVLLVDLAWTWRLGLVDAVWSPPPVGYALGDGRGAVAITAVSLVAIALGAVTRPACIAFVIASARMSAVAPYGESAFDMLARVVMAILALSRCNARWSIDAWVARARGKPMPAEIPAWPRYLLLLQLVWVYFSAGQNKASAAWGPHGGFTALANALTDPHAARWSPAWIAAVYPLTRVATALTMAFELGAPLYVVAYARGWTRVRWAWIALGIAFELGIAATLRLGSFPFGMLALYPVLLTPDELQRWNTVAPAKRASSPS